MRVLGGVKQVAEREGFDYAISSKYKELLPLAHSSLCLCWLQPHSYLRVQCRIVATVSTVLVFLVGGLRYYYDSAYGDGGDPMLKRSDSAMERALALDPNLIDAAAALTS